MNVGDNMDKHNNWTKIADHQDGIVLGDNHIAVVEVNSKTICIVKFEDRLFAFTSVCPHAGGFLGDGCITGPGYIVCPVHHYKFNIRNGHNVSGEGYHLTHWPVVVKEDGIYVAIT